MGRSVSTPSNAAHVVHATLDYQEDMDFAQEQFQDALFDLRVMLRKRFASVVSEDRWIGREDHVIARNRHAVFGISEYCGLVAVWCCVDNDDQPDLAEQWVASIAKNFTRVVKDVFGETLSCVATASNGESFFRREA